MLVGAVDKKGMRRFRARTICLSSIVDTISIGFRSPALVDVLLQLFLGGYVIYGA